MQRALAMIYPDQCIACDAPVEGGHGLCGACWRDTPFVTGAICDLCGTPVPGDPAPGIACDECLTLARPWRRGRTALIYRDRARRLVLALKHGDRLDLAPAAAAWMVRATDGLPEDALFVPVPAHWRRLIRRRYNQAAVLAAELARRTGHDHAPRALFRSRPTPVQDGMGVAARFANLAGAIAAHPRHGRVLEGREVVLVDDVMTSGATLAAATDACHAAGASGVSVLTLARVVKDA